MAFQSHRLPALLRDAFSNRLQERITTGIRDAAASGKLPPEIVSSIEFTLFDLGSEPFDLEIESVLRADPLEQPDGVRQVVFFFKYSGSAVAEFQCDVQVNPISGRHALFETKIVQRPVILPLHLRLEHLKLGGKLMVTQSNANPKIILLCVKSSPFHDVSIRSNFERHMMSAHETLRRTLISTITQTCDRLVDDEFVIHLGDDDKDKTVAASTATPIPKERTSV